MFFDPVDDILKTHEAAREQDPVDFPAQDRAHLADHLRDLVDHGIPDERCFSVALFLHPVDHVGVRGTEEAHKTAGTGTEEPGLLQVVRFQVVQDRKHRDAADPGGRERAFPVGAHVAVDHAAAFVCADRNAAVNVRDDEIAVFIAPAHGTRVEFRNGFLVQHMGVRDAVNAADPGQPCIVTVFVHVGRVQRVSVLLKSQGELPGEHDAELGRMFAAADCFYGVVKQLFVDLRHAAGLCAGAAAAADKDVDRSRVHVFLFEHVQDDPVAEGHLVVDVREL